MSIQQIKMTNKAREAARSLAVAYSAFNEAEKPNSKVVWGDMLIEAQKETGIELLSETTINRIIKINRAKNDE